MGKLRSTNGTAQFHQWESPVSPVELRRQTNEVISFGTFNGLVVLEVHGLVSVKDCEAVKEAAMSMTQTLAAFTGATGQEVIILVWVAQHRRPAPQTREKWRAILCETFHLVHHPTPYTPSYTHPTPPQPLDPHPSTPKKV